MAFRFRLETVRRVRERLLEAARMELGRAMARKRELEEQVELLELQIKREQQELLEEMAQGIMAHEYQARTGLIQNLQKLLRQKRKELERAVDEVAQSRREVEARYREKELVERLKEREFRAHLHDESRREQNEIDDIVAMRRGSSIAQAEVTR